MSLSRSASTDGVLLLLVLALLAAPGCIRAPAKSGMMRTAQDLQDMTTAQLRLRVHAFADRFAGVVEGAADVIIEQTDDPAIRRRALTWKMDAIAECQKAAFHYDPLAGLIDVAALSGQMVQLFEPGGAGADDFGPWQGLAIETARTLQEDVWQLAESISKSGDVGRTREMVAEWVEEHPIDGVVMVRDSTRSLSAEWAADTGRGAGAAIGSITDTVGDLSDRLTIYAETIPKQARWQAQMLVYDMLDEAELGNLGSTTASLADSIERIASTVELTPELIARERAKSFEEIDLTTRTVVDSVDRQRTATIDALRGERIALLEALEKERIAVLDAVHAERVDTIDRVAADLGVLVTDSFERADDLVDRIFWRVAVLLAAAGAGLLVVGLILARSYCAWRVRE